jgi:phage repressor protein C with HTH and peptisase S24 domain
MLPTLKPGQIVIGLRRGSTKPGRLVIVDHGGREIVKRLAKVSKNKLYIVGDNQAHSSDSRHYGWINKNCLLATVIWPKS